MGETLALKIAEHCRDGDSVLLFYDSIKSTPPPRLYVAGKTLDAFHETLGKRRLAVLGAGLLGDFQMNNSYVMPRSAPVGRARIR